MIQISQDPFYINPKGKNLITDELKARFVAKNPELKIYVQNYPISLRLIQLDDFTAFCYWIIGQHISGKVADVLVERLNLELGPLSPQKIKSTPIEKLREIGISNPKSQYLHNLADFFIGSLYVDHKELSSKDLIDYFTQINGIGEWTVQMHLIFAYGRMDIFSPKDLVVRKGLSKLYNLSEIPTEKQAKVIGSKWGDLSTLGTILCWAVMGE